MDELFTALEEMSKPRPGWVGSFTTQESPGAFPNGTRIAKVDQDNANDLTPIGTEGTVLGSMRHPDPKLGLCYFIEWDDKPRCAVAVVAWKIGRAKAR